MYKLLMQLSNLRLGPVTPDTDKSIDIFTDELPGAMVLEFASGSKHNGWQVPQNWYVTKAEIWNGEELIYDGLANPIRVIGYSGSFSGTVDRKELSDHLFTHSFRADLEPYHCDLYYKQNTSNWGFTVSQNWLDALEPGNYRVELETVHEPGTMKVFEYTLPGETEEVIVLNAHNCHAGQSNDDISGIVVQDGPFHPFQAGIVYRQKQGATYIATRSRGLCFNDVVVHSRDHQRRLRLGDRLATPKRFLDEGRTFRPIIGPNGLMNLPHNNV
jgi:aminopeptidase-like protein